MNQTLRPFFQRRRHNTRRSLQPRFFTPGIIVSNMPKDLLVRFHE
jgi:hypothetical protein